MTISIALILYALAFAAGMIYGRIEEGNHESA